MGNSYNIFVNTWIRKPMRYLILISVILLCFFALFDRDYILNFTKSIPVGIYKVKKIGKSYKFKKDVIVMIKPSDSLSLFLHKRKYFEFDDKYLLKKIIGVAGDKIEIKGNDVYLNQIFIGAIKDKDSQDRILKSSLKSGVIPENYVFVKGDTDNSIDSRYLGLIPINSIIRKVKLVFSLKFLSKIKIKNREKSKQIKK